MKLTWRQIDGFLKNPDPEIVAVLVYGPDEGLVRERAKTLGQTVVEDMSDPFNVIELTTQNLMDDPARLADETHAISMMGGRRLIRIRDGVDKITAVFKPFLKDKPETENLIVVEAGDLGPRSTLRSLFEKDKKTAALPCYIEDERNLSQFMQTQLRSAGFSISRDALQFSVANLVGDRAVARGEIEKLITYMQSAPDKQVTLEDAVACIGNSAALTLEDVARGTASGQIVAMNRALNQLFSEGMPPVTVLRTVQTYFRRLHVTRSHMHNGESRDQAIKQLQPPVFFKLRPAFEAQLNIWSLPLLDKALGHLMETESQCKQSGLPDQALCAQALLAISQLAKSRSRSRAA